MNKSREAFEKWTKTIGWQLSLIRCKLDLRYLDDCTQCAYLAWQERQAEVDEQFNLNVALNAENIKHREYIQDLLLRNSVQRNDFEQQQRKIKQAISILSEPNKEICDQGWFALKALRGGQSSKSKRDCEIEFEKLNRLG